MLLASMNGQRVINGLGFHSYHRLGLMGSGDVQALQQALANLAIATGRPSINPGKIDGTVGTATVMAVISATDLLAESLPQSAFLALKAGTAIASASKTVDTNAIKAVEFLAVPLTVAANTAAVKFKTKSPAVAMPPGVASFFAPGWYKTPPGIALIIAGLFVGYKLLGPKAA